MDDPKVVIEGEVKHWTSKKWKSRWCVLTKLSPVADCLHLQIYRSSKDRYRNGPTKSSLSLDGFLGMEAGFILDKESNTLALICREILVILAFDSRERLIQWQVHIRTHTQQVEQFLVQITLVPSKSKLICGPARLHLQNKYFCLVTGLPPKISGHWNLSHLRKFGVIDGKFCFEGGTLCLKGEGLHALRTNLTEELLKAFELASVGKLDLKRKALHRISSERCPCWLLSHSEDPKFQSNESCPKVMATACGSEGSASDLYLESFPVTSSSASCLHTHHHHSNCHGDINCISDDAASTRSTCFTNLLWSSAISDKAVSEIYSSSINSDLNSFSTRTAEEASSSNKYFENYDVPRCVETMKCPPGMSEPRVYSLSNIDEISNPDSSPYRSNRDVDFCFEENYENSSVIYSHLMSSSSTTSSNSSGGPTYASTSLSCTPVTSAVTVTDPFRHYSVVMRKGEKVRSHQEGRKCSSNSTCSSLQEKVDTERECTAHHYQVPRTATANLYRTDIQASGSTEGVCQKYCPPTLKLLSNSGELYDSPKEVKV